MKSFHVATEVWLGKLANAVGAPGVIKDVEYKSALDGTSVSVRRGCLYTVVSVNGVDVYFRRFGGAIDGVVSGRPQQKSKAAPESGSLAACSPLSS